MVPISCFLCWFFRANEGGLYHSSHESQPIKEQVHLALFSCVLVHFGQLLLLLWGNRPCLFPFGLVGTTLKGKNSVKILGVYCWFSVHKFFIWIIRQRTNSGIEDWQIEIPCCLIPDSPFTHLLKHSGFMLKTSLFSQRLVLYDSLVQN